jgi:hypothetical protein
MEEVCSRAKDANLVLALKAKSLPQMQAANSRFENGDVSTL